MDSVVLFAKIILAIALMIVGLAGAIAASMFSAEASFSEDKGLRTMAFAMLGITLGSFVMAGVLIYQVISY